MMRGTLFLLLVAILGGSKTAGHATGGNVKHLRSLLKQHRHEIAGNRSSFLATDLEIGSPDNVGSLTCMRWTGGTCAFSPCKSERGPTSCISGKCVCQPGSCADSEGKCSLNSQGKWIGEYSIRFMNPSIPRKPYIGLGNEGKLPFSDTRMTNLGVTEDSWKQWKIALTPNGRVRFQSMSHPGSALVMRKVRKEDTLLQTLEQNSVSRTQQGQTGNGTAGKFEILPVIVNLEYASPIAASFQVRPTLKDGGGLEIWSPTIGASLASSTSAASQGGIGKCMLVETGLCQGRQLVEFDPELPATAHESAPRAIIKAIPSLYIWQVLLLLCFVMVCFAAIWVLGAGCVMGIVYGLVYIWTNRHRASAIMAQTTAPPARPAPPRRPHGKWSLTSDQGRFEYDFQERPGQGFLFDVRGRVVDGTWDEVVVGRLNLDTGRRWPWESGNSSGPTWVLRFQGLDGTNFELEFLDDNSLTGRASLAGASLSIAGTRIHA